MRFRKAQSTVELLLVLPIFMLIICFIMEIGFLAYQTILAHHAAYEILRIGSLVAGPAGGTTNPDMAINVGKARDKMEEVLGQFFPKGGTKLYYPTLDETGSDPQTDYSGKSHKHYDLVLKLEYTAKLAFPFSSYLLSDSGKRGGTRKITVQMRMPVEVPVFN